MSWDEPTTIDEACMLAKTLASSPLLPTELRDPASMLLLMGYAKALHLPVFSAVRMIQIIKGKPTLSADGMAAVVRRSDLVQQLDVVESTDERCTVAAQRRGGSPFEVVWDLARAKRSRLGGQQWDSYPRQMLRARALSEACRLGWPDVVGGVYDPSEVQPQETEQAQQPKLVAEPQPKQLAAEPERPNDVGACAADCARELERRGLADALAALREGVRRIAGTEVVTVKHVLAAYDELCTALEAQ